MKTSELCPVAFVDAFVDLHQGANFVAANDEVITEPGGLATLDTEPETSGLDSVRWIFGGIS